MPASARSYSRSVIILRIRLKRGRKQSKRFLEGTSMLSKIKLINLNLSIRLAAIARSLAVRKIIVSATKMVLLAYLEDVSVSTARMRSPAVSMSLYWIV